MKTIAVIHPSSELYGADRIMVNALKALPKEVKKVVYLKFEGPLVDFIHEQVENAEVKVIPFIPIIYRKIFNPTGVYKFGRQWMKFRNFFKKEQERYAFYSIYVNTLSASFVLPIVRALKISNYIHVHEIIENPKFVGRVTAKLCKRYADNIIAVSKAVKSNLEDYVPELKDKITVIHNGIKEVASMEKKPLGQLEFYLFGRIMPKKGQWFLIEALSLLSKETLKECRFTLMGGALQGKEHLLEDLQNEIKSNGLSDYVRILDFAPHIGEAMKEAHVCLVPSMMKDPFPTTVLEAMSAGRPVIATNHGGAKEAIVNGKTGVLINKGDAESLAEVIRSIVEYPDHVYEMGQNGKDRYEDLFTLEKFNERWNIFLLDNELI